MINREVILVKQIKSKGPFKSKGLLIRRTGDTQKSILIPIISVVLAFVFGAIIIAASDVDTINAGRSLFVAPGIFFRFAGEAISDAYLAMLEGAFGNPSNILEAFRQWRLTGDETKLLSELRPISESLVIATPYIFAGLGVAISFQAGLVNIGAEGQLFVAGLFSVFVAYSLQGLPRFIHLPLSLLAGFTAGALWGFIPGFLKAKTGAHEVINTIMLNYIAFRFTDYLLAGPMAKSPSLPISPDVPISAQIPTFLSAPVRLHWGLIFAIFLAWLVDFLLFKTTFGLEIRMTGKNPSASRYAGITISKITIIAMALSGGIAGLAGANQVLGVDHRMVRAFSSGYGFDAIALALLGNNNPLGVVFSSLLFGFLRGGAARMQSVAGTPVELIKIIQGIVIIFVAAPDIIQKLFIKKKRDGNLLPTQLEENVNRGSGGANGLSK